MLDRAAGPTRQVWRLALRVGAQSVATRRNSVASARQVFDVFENNQRHALEWEGQPPLVLVTQLSLL